MYRMSRLQLTSTASSKVASLDQKIGFTEKLSVGTTIVNDKVKEMDEKFQVSEKTNNAFAAAEQTVSSAGSAIMKNRYILTGASWVTADLAENFWEDDLVHNPLQGRDLRKVVSLHKIVIRGRPQILLEIAPLQML
ncbi:hypothetical protein QQ045_027379 [Rhodiola kirilowii]